MTNNAKVLRNIEKLSRLYPRDVVKFSLSSFCDLGDAYVMVYASRKERASCVSGIAAYEEGKLRPFAEIRNRIANTLKAAGIYAREMPTR